MNDQTAIRPHDFADHYRRNLDLEIRRYYRNRKMHHGDDWQAHSDHEELARYVANWITGEYVRRVVNGEYLVCEIVREHPRLIGYVDFTHAMRDLVEEWTYSILEDATEPANVREHNGPWAGRIAETAWELVEADGENVHDLTSQDRDAYAQIAAAQYDYTAEDVLEVPPGERLLDHDRAQLAIFRYLREQAAAMAQEIEAEYVREWTS